MRQITQFSFCFLLYSSLATHVFAVDATTELLAQKGVITAEEYEKIKKAQTHKQL